MCGLPCQRVRAAATEAAEAGGRRKIPAKKFDPAADRRKRQLGSEGESWALAAMIDLFLAMTPDDRAAAIDEVLGLVAQLEGAADLARGHAEAARDRAPTRRR